jgi:2-hydroxychromene-2-carboxylate isomerase
MRQNRVQEPNPDAMKTLQFYYDIACPYAYLASTQIEAICRATDTELQWKPILLGGLYRSVGGKDHPAASWPAAKVLHNQRDMRRQAELFGVELAKPASYPQRTVNTMRLLLAAPESIRGALTHRLYRAYWVEGQAVGERTVLAKIAAEFDLDIAQKPLLLTTRPFPLPPAPSAPPWPYYLLKKANETKPWH